MATPIVTGLPRWPWRYLFLSVLDREDNGDIGLHLYSIAAFGVIISMRKRSIMPTLFIGNDLV